jgi:uncharacterized membrane protein
VSILVEGYARAVSTYDWLLMFHITGAFLLVAGSVTAGTLNALAWRQERPSEVALLLRLIKFAVIPIGIGAVLTLVLGLWLVHHAGYSYGAFWIWAAIVLWVVTSALGSGGGRRQEKAREVAERLAASGDVSSEELRALVRDPVGNAMSYCAGLSTLAIIVLMIWKPGQ